MRPLIISESMGKTVWAFFEVIGCYNIFVEIHFCWHVLKTVEHKTGFDVII